MLKMGDVNHEQKNQKRSDVNRDPDNLLEPGEMSEQSRYKSLRFQWQ